MASLRSRQLVSGFTIIVIGILLLGALLSFSIYQRKTETISNELERTALDLLGYIEFDKGSFLISEPNQADSDVFMDERKLRQQGKKRFAYIWDTHQEKIIWDSLDNDNVDQARVKEHFVLFDFDAILRKNPGQNFSPAKATKMYPRSSDAGEAPSQYLVAAQQFTLRLDDGKRAYLFIVATAMEEVENEAYGLVMMFSTLFLIAAGLILLAQFAFSLWVVSPIRAFEQEVRAIRNGTKTSIENPYPDELSAIKDTINELAAYKQDQQ